MERLIKKAEMTSYELSSEWKFKVETLEENEYDSKEDINDFGCDYVDDEIIDKAKDYILQDFNSIRNDLEQYCEEDLEIPVVFELGVYDDELILTVTTENKLNEEQKAALKGWWDGQLSDGWGEGLEDHEIYHNEDYQNTEISEYISYDEYLEALGYNEEEVGDEYYDDYCNENVETTINDTYFINTFFASTIKEV